MTPLLSADAAKEVHIQSHESLKPLEAGMFNLVAGGTYEHYSGKRYHVIGLARHTETNEELVIYKSLDDGNLWVRPVAMFIETISLNGSIQPRFRLVE